MISQDLQREIASLAINANPEEVCGFVVDGQVVPCVNIHESPCTNFAIAAEDYMKAEELGNIEAIYHSHNSSSPAKFSLHDIKSCKQSNVPWVMYSMRSGNFYYADPTGNVPYEERQWIYGIHDCYSLVRDFHRREFGIVLDDFDRGEELEWQSKDWQMFSRNYAKQGFRRIDRPSQKGDVLLMQIDAPFPNHVGVMTGDGILFYHHLMDRLSEKAIWGGMWEKVTSYVLRHESL